MSDAHFTPSPNHGTEIDPAYWLQQLAKQMGAEPQFGPAKYNVAMPQGAHVFVDDVFHNTVFTPGDNTMAERGEVDVMGAHARVIVRSLAAVVRAEPSGANRDIEIAAEHARVNGATFIYQTESDVLPHVKDTVEAIRQADFWQQAAWRSAIAKLGDMEYNLKDPKATIQPRAFATKLLPGTVSLGVDVATNSPAVRQFLDIGVAEKFIKVERREEQSGAPSCYRIEGARNLMRLGLLLDVAKASQLNPEKLGEMGYVPTHAGGVIL